MQKVKHKNLILFSFVVNLATWVLWLFALRHFREQQLQVFLNYSTAVFFFGAAFKWMKDRGNEVPNGVGDVEWPSSLMLLHAIPFLNLAAYVVYFICGGKSNVTWALMFLAPFVAGTGFVSCANFLNKK